VTGEQASSKRRASVVTLLGVAAIVAVVVVANLASPAAAPDALTDAPTVAALPTASRGAQTDTQTDTQTETRAEVEAERLETMAPEEIAGEAIDTRPQVVPPGAEDLAEAAEDAASLQPFSFVLTSFNVLGSQHSAPGGAAAEFADGGVRTERAAGLIASYGSDVVGFSEMQPDQYVVMTRAAPGYTFYPGTTLGRAGVPTNVMWRTDVWESTFQSSVSIPFMDSTRPMPIVRLRHLETGREIYVLNVHNSPKDRQGREEERDKAEAIEIAAINELAGDGLPILVMGDFNEKAEIFCRLTARTLLISASGGSNGGADGGGCRPPVGMRVDWIFGSPEVAFSGLRFDASPTVRAITDHAVLTTGVTVPVP